MSLSMEDRGKINLAVSNVAAALSPEVAYIRFSIGPDWSDEPAIHFRIVLSDSFSRDGRMRGVRAVERALRDALDFDALGLRTYENYRTTAEQAAMKEPEWAAP